MGRPIKNPDLTTEVLAQYLSEGYSQKWVAQKYGVSNATVSRLKQQLKTSFGKMPNVLESNSANTVNDSESLDPQQPGE